MARSSRPIWASKSNFSMTSRVSGSKAAIQARRLPATWAGSARMAFRVRRRGVVDLDAGDGLEDGADGLDGQGLDAGEDLGFGGLEDAVEAAQHDERQDDAAVLGLLVVAAQQVGDRPDEAGVVAMGTGRPGRGVLTGGHRRV